MRLGYKQLEIHLQAVKAGTEANQLQLHVIRNFNSRIVKSLSTVLLARKLVTRMPYCPRVLHWTVIMLLDYVPKASSKLVLHYTPVIVI